MLTPTVQAWLLEGDVSIQYQTQRDLLGQDLPALQARIATEGWGKQFLDSRHPEGHWGEQFYQPKWQSTHYTLVDLRHLNLPPHQPQVQSSIQQILDTGKADDGGIRLGPSTADRSDVCVNGMVLNYASYFQRAQQDLESLVDMLLGEHMPDGGFNCRTTRSGAVHSSLHSTISVLEGFHAYLSAGHTYRQAEVQAAQAAAQEFFCSISCTSQTAPAASSKTNSYACPTPAAGSMTSCGPWSISS
ncbi:MAG: hypothetical protein AAFQ98_18835 [Bacteroidota bacterium]